MNRKRIDFTLFQPAAKPESVNGLLRGATTALLSEDLALQSVIDKISHGNLVVWVSEGNWSMHEMLLSLLNITGAAEVTISSYAMSETAARVLTQLKLDGMISRLSCLLDNRVDTRSAGSFQLIGAMADRMVMVVTHAKVTVIKNDQWTISVVGSANYTENKRWECGIVDTAAAVAEFHLSWMNKAIENGSQ